METKYITVVQRLRPKNQTCASGVHIFECLSQYFKGYNLVVH